MSWKSSQHRGRMVDNQKIDLMQRFLKTTIAIHALQNISKPHLPLLHQSHGMRKANLVGKRVKIGSSHAFGFR